MAIPTCPDGYARIFDADANVQYCQSIAEPALRAPLITDDAAPTQANVIALGGLTAAAIVAVAYLLVPQRATKRRRR